ncbi:M43 family zinc metalloprotease [Flavobacterium sedimenticola]|uniref:M43 family zinc metalloprotease n=1 Tax=Flavobacterium sedimenticola TaxID=3043286 RepID=A0ABT6XMH5_9FLAO|nr:M43 family zinc metalloprotease [Flavobacterium sedimenticola]MDI9256298.1 M43 family zinc metalloprotease [Flavobacterium sedimenticola]
MKKIILSLLLISSLGAYSQRTCATNTKLEQLKANDPSFAVHHQETMDYIRNNATAQTNRAPEVVITIPVVVHVLYKTAAQNISDAQILSQIAILNADYRKTNTDFNTVVPAAFQPFGADVELAFCLATRTPSGQATNGIERKSVPSNFVFEDSYYTSAGLTAWNPTKYLNIWVGRFTDSSLLGFAYLPSSAGAAFDGLCIGDQYFGNTGTATFPFNKGRTATHEIGHYFGLEHPWGDAQCDTDDGVADTPGTYSPYFGCPTYPNNTNVCAPNATGAMFMNYMDYVDDRCMAFFTNGQKAVMQATMNGPRVSLKTSNGCQSLSVTEQEAIQAIAVYPNPVSQYFFITSPHTAVDFVEIFNTSGQLVQTQTLDDVNNKIVIDQLASGIYYLRIYNEGNYLKSDKIIKK